MHSRTHLCKAGAVVSSDSAVSVPSIEHAVYIRVSRERIYETLTSAEGWNAWFTQEAHVEPRVGGEVRFTWRHHGPDCIDLEDGGPVVEVERHRCFAFEWSPGSAPTTVRFVLEERGAGAVVRLTERGYGSSRS